MRCLLILAAISVSAFACSSADNKTGAIDAGKNDAGKPVEPVADGGGSAVEADGGKVDSGKVPPPDAGAAGSACSPGSVTGFVPQWIPPTPLHQNKCTGSQIATLVDCLFNGSANATTCDTFFNAASSADCQTCAVAGATEASLGPLLISLDGLVTLNVAGCIARTANDITATGCGAKVAAPSQCASAACDPNCPVLDGDAKALAERNTCQRAAIAGACVTYQKDAEACSTPLLQGVSSACAAGSTFTDIAINLATLFCAD